MRPRSPKSSCRHLARSAGVRLPCQQGDGQEGDEEGEGAEDRTAEGENGALQ